MVFYVHPLLQATGYSGAVWSAVGTQRRGCRIRLVVQLQLPEVLPVSTDKRSGETTNSRLRCSLNGFRHTQ